MRRPSVESFAQTALPPPAGADTAGPGWLPVPPRLLAAATAAALILLFGLSLLRLHGFSLPCWRMLDGSPPDEVLIGKARSIRSDDFVVVLPMVFSQDAQHPSFPVRSRLIGDGNDNVLVGPAVPVRHVVGIFQPQLWGYFAGRDFGMAWQWWFRALALVYVWWLVLCVVSEGRIGLAMLGSVGLLFSPFLQYWSMNSEPMIASAGAAFLAAVGVARSRSVRAIALHGLLLAWAGGVFALGVIYPPFQVCLAYLFLAMALGYAVRERARLASIDRRVLRIGVLAAAAVLVAIALALYMRDALDAIRIMSATLYPGRRTVTGGDLTIFRVFNNFFTFEPFFQSRTPFGNICEGASFYLVFPVVVAAALLGRLPELARARARTSPSRGSMQEKIDPLFGAVVLYLAGLLAYAVLGVPEIVAKLTLLNRVEGYRCLLAIGLADVILWSAFLARRPPVAGTGSGKRAVALGLAAAWSAGLFALGLASRARLGNPPLALIAVLAVVFGGVGLAFALRRKFAGALVTAAGFISTAWFNPVVMGGAGYLTDNPLSRTIVSLDRATGGGRWVVFNDPVLPNLLRAIGVHAIDGLHPYPQLGLWSRLDPEGALRYAYNRYAHVGFLLPESKDDFRIFSTKPDIIVVLLDPAHPAFEALGVDFVILGGDRKGALEGRANLERVAEVSGYPIYRVRRRTPGAGAGGGAGGAPGG